MYVDGKTVYQVGNKKKINYTEMHGQQNIKTCIPVELEAGWTLGEEKHLLARLVFTALSQ